VYKYQKIKKFESIFFLEAKEFNKTITKGWQLKTGKKFGKKNQNL